MDFSVGQDVFYKMVTFTMRPGESGEIGSSYLEAVVCAVHFDCCTIKLHNGRVRSVRNQDLEPIERLRL